MFAGRLCAAFAAGGFCGVLPGLSPLIRGTFFHKLGLCSISTPERPRSTHMHGIIYLVGLIVVIMAILSFFGLR
jgi:hypothetical protein